MVVPIQVEGLHSKCCLVRADVIVIHVFMMWTFLVDTGLLVVLILRSNSCMSSLQSGLTVGS